MFLVILLIFMGILVRFWNAAATQACLIMLCLFTLMPHASADTIRVNGVERSYILEAPVSAKNAPLIVALHGGGGSDKQLRRSTGLSPAANAQGVIVVYPNAVAKNWNDGRLNLRKQLVHEGDDVGFLTALVNDLVARGLVDPKRVVFAGISNGGMMAFKMACDSGLGIYGVAAIAANIPEPLDCTGARPRLLNIVGTEDKFVPMAGGYVWGSARRGAVKSAADTFAIFLKAQGCTGTRKTMMPDRVDDGMQSSLITGVGCSVSLIAQITVTGGGHAWAGASGPLEFITGKPTMDFSATEMVVRFAVGRGVGE